jgi:putative transposase
VEDSAEGGRVSFSYRDRKNGNQTRRMTLEAWEFIRRFLLHVLPEGLKRIRHYGLLANRSKKGKLAQCRELLGAQQQPTGGGKKTARQIMVEVTGFDPGVCPACGVGTLVIVEQLPALGLATYYCGRAAMDSS